MMLMNDWSTVWAMSFMASIFLHILLVHETKVMLPQAIISVLLAYFSVYVVVDAAPSQMISWTYVPILSLLMYSVICSTFAIRYHTRAKHH